MEIITEKNDYALTDKTVISAGQSTTVKAGEFHRFRVLEDTVAYEIYWVEGINPADIVRRDHGGAVWNDPMDSGIKDNDPQDGCIQLLNEERKTKPERPPNRLIKEGQEPKR